MSKLMILVASATALFVSPSQTIASDWQILFDGTSLDGWKHSKGNDQFDVVDGVILGSSSDQTRFLYTSNTYGDFELELEIKLSDPDLNSGVQIRSSTSRQNDAGRTIDVIHGPQVDIGKSPGRSGYIYGQGNKGWFTPEEDLARHSLMKDGQWNKVRVLAVGQKIQTWINDQQVSDLVVSDEIHERYGTGVIALQVHGVKKSPEKVRHVSFRSIRVREISE